MCRFPSGFPRAQPYKGMSHIHACIILSDTLILWLLFYFFVTCFNMLQQDHNKKSAARLFKNPESRVLN